MIKFLIVLLFGAFVLGQVGRVPITESITLNIFDVALVLFLSSVLVRQILQKKKIELFKYPILLFLGFIVTGGISLLVHSFALDQVEIIAALLYLVRWILYMSAGIVVMQLSSKEKEFIKLNMLLSGVLIVLIGYVQYVLYPDLKNLYYLGWDDHLYRMFSTFLDPNFAGAFFVLFFFFLLYFYTRKRFEFTIKTLFLYGSTVLTFGAIFLTYSRTALLMFLIGSIVWLILIGRKKVIVLFVAGILIAYALFAGQLEGLNPFRTASVTARIESANNAFKIFQDNPVIGVGFNAYRYAQQEYGFRTGPGAVRSHSEASTDNSYLFVLATTGVIGMFLYIFGWLNIVKSIYRKSIASERRLRVLFIVSLSAVAFGSLFTNLFFYTPLLFWIMCLYGITQNKKP